MTAALDDWLHALLVDESPALAPIVPASTPPQPEKRPEAVVAPKPITTPSSPVTSSLPPIPKPAVNTHRPAPIPAKPADSIAATPLPTPASVMPTSLPSLSTATASPWATLQAQAQQAAAPVANVETISRWLRLRCGGQTYAVELLKVQEVVLPLPMLGLRGSETAMLGIMNLRGQVVPVIDLGLYLGSAAANTDSHTRIVVLEENGQALGLRTDAVDDVAHLMASQIEIPDATSLCRNADSLFCGMARIDEQPTILLDAAKLLQGER